MKFKFLQAEFEFNKDDAKIAVPLVLLGLGMAFTPAPRPWLLVSAAVYYLLLFFLLEPLKKWLIGLYYKWVCRCPYCKSHRTVMLGMQNYLGDIPYDWYRCNDCGKESVLLENELVQPDPRKKRNLTTG